MCVCSGFNVIPARVGIIRYVDFSMTSDSEGEYKCPICCLKEKEIGDYRPSTNNAIFSAKDLLQTELSNHIEERLFRRLKQDRIERAKVAGKRFDEVVREMIMIHSIFDIKFLSYVMRKL